MTVYSNNTCFQSYQEPPESSYSGYTSTSGVCLPEGSSYTLHATGAHTNGTCAALDKVIYQYKVQQQGPGCQPNEDSTWRLGNTQQCGSTLPSAATAPTLQPTVAVVQQFTGYLKQEFFTDSSCLQPFKTVFSSSGQCFNTLSGQFNSSELRQYDVVGNQVVKNVVYYNGLDCKEFSFQGSAVVTPTTCSLYPYWSDGGDSRQDLYSIQSFVPGTATPSVPYTGIITSR